MPAVVIATALLTLVLAVALIVFRTPRSRRDPKRMYDAAQRRVALERAHYRCEMTSWWILRCRRVASHIDHHYPHSKGGATSLKNAVASCAHHNTSKGAKLPTRTQTLLIALRRRRYFPKGSERYPGQWY